MIPEEQKISQEEAEACLLSLFAGWQMVELMDKISETSLYRHQLKLRVNQLMPELEKHTDKIGDLFSVDSEALNNLMEHKKGLALKLCKMKPELQAGLDEIIDKYLMMPEWFLHHNGIQITKQ